MARFTMDPDQFVRLEQRLAESQVAVDRLTETVMKSSQDTSKWLALLVQSLSDDADNPTQEQIDELAAQINASSDTTEQAVNEQNEGGQ